MWSTGVAAGLKRPPAPISWAAMKNPLQVFEAL